MTRINKSHGGSYVVEKGKTRKVEGTVEPEISAPRDKHGNRLDRPAGSQKPEVRTASPKKNQTPKPITG